jgi:hypothetical protein
MVNLFCLLPLTFALFICTAVLGARARQGGAAAQNIPYGGQQPPPRGGQQPRRMH